MTCNIQQIFSVLFYEMSEVRNNKNSSRTLSRPVVSEGNGKNMILLCTGYEKGKLSEWKIN